MSWGRVVDVEVPALPPLPVAYMGTCKGCGRRLPVGYLPVVTGWQKVELVKGLAISKPTELYCRGCAAGIQGPERVHRRRQPRAIESQGVSLKELAYKLWAALPGAGRGFGSKKLARIARVGYCPEVKVALRKLRDAGKVVFEEGRWRKA